MHVSIHTLRYMIHAYNRKMVKRYIYIYPNSPPHSRPHSHSPSRTHCAMSAGKCATNGGPNTASIFARKAARAGPGHALSRDSHLNATWDASSKSAKSNCRCRSCAFSILHRSSPWTLVVDTSGGWTCQSRCCTSDHHCWIIILIMLELARSLSSWSAKISTQQNWVNAMWAGVAMSLDVERLLCLEHENRLYFYRIFRYRSYLSIYE